MVYTRVVGRLVHRVVYTRVVGRHIHHPGYTLVGRHIHHPGIPQGVYRVVYTHQGVQGVYRVVYTHQGVQGGVYSGWYIPGRYTQGGIPGRIQPGNNRNNPGITGKRHRNPLQRVLLHKGEVSRETSPFCAQTPLRSWPAFSPATGPTALGLWPSTFPTILVSFPLFPGFCYSRVSGYSGLFPECQECRVSRSDAKP